MMHRIIAAVAAIALAAGLVPLPAFAANSLHADGTTTGNVVIGTQAAKKTSVYVLTKVKTNSTVRTTYVYRAPARRYSEKATTTYSYNKNGQVIKGASKSTAGSSTRTPAVTLRYDKNRVKSFKVSRAGALNNGSYTLAYNRKGRNVRTTDASGAVTKHSYDKKGRRIKSTSTKKIGNIKSPTWKYTYNAKGLRATVTLIGNKGTTNEYEKDTEYRYDSRGNAKHETIVETGSNLERNESIDVSNTYRKNLLKKSKTTIDTGTLTYRKGQESTSFMETTKNSTYTYKRIKVPTSLVKQVKAQQWSLINGIDNGSVPYLL